MTKLLNFKVVLAHFVLKVYREIPGTLREIPGTLREFPGTLREIHGTLL